jgi:site-specific DNA recombinase
MKKPTETKRCAIYTRKSTEEGLDQEFNTLDAQRESGEAFIKSQANEGWTCSAEKYDDGGYTGGNMDRPALKRLMADIEAGKSDCVVVYKVDRLSRSLLDFARMMEVFEKHNVAFVSVTQQFNTASSMGRLILNVLLSFAQFEREMISERTRDKMAAARRKGKYVGGSVPLGYDVDHEAKKLVVNDAEAKQVLAIFELYAEHQALLPVVTELAERGVTNKLTKCQNGKRKGGSLFNKGSLHKLLVNPTYIGKVQYKGETFPGQQPAIVPTTLWQRVQTILERNNRTGGAPVRNKYSALLKGILRCSACACAMTPTYSVNKRGQQYRYYVCSSAQKSGWHTCPSKSVPASEIERFVIDQIACVGQDDALVRATFTEARRQTESRLSDLDAERRRLERERGRTTDIDARHEAERRLAEIHAEQLGLERSLVTEAEVATALGDFPSLWESLTPKEQAKVIALLVERVEYNGATGKIALTFQPTGIRTLIEQYATEEEAA